MRFSTSILAAATLLCFVAIQPVRADDPVIHAQKAHAAAEQKDWKTAIAEMDIVIALDGKNASAYQMRSSLHRQNGDREKADADLVQVLKLDPDEFDKFRVASQAALDQKNWIRAINMWSLLESARRDARTLYGKGLALAGYQSIIDAEVKGVFNIKDLTLKDLEATVGKSNVNINSTRLSFELAILKDPKFVPAYVALAGARIPGNGDYEYIRGKDRAALDKGLKLMPDNVDLLVARGQLLGDNYVARKTIEKRKEEAKLAIPDFDRALQLDPKNAVAVASRARAYRNFYNFDMALADTDRALELKPDNADMFKLRGDIYSLKGGYAKYDYVKSAAAYERAIALDPDPANSRVRLDWFLSLRELPNKTRAFEVIGKLVQEFPRNDDYVRLRANLYLDQKDFVRALADADKYIKLAPKDKYATELRAEIIAAQKVGR